MKFEFEDIASYKIIGHPIVLTDILHWIKQNWSILEKEDELFPGHCYKEARLAWDDSKPYYDDQSDELKEIVRDMVARFNNVK